MDFAERELLVARVIAGCVRCRLRDIAGRERVFLLKNPDRYHRYVAQEVYQEAFREGELSGLLSEEELLGFLIDEGLWSEDEDTKIKDLEKNLEELKVRLFELQFKQYEQKLARKMLDVTRTELAALSERRHAHDSNTCAGAASIARLRYLIGASLCYPNGTPVFRDEESFWKETNHLIDEAFEPYVKSRLTEPQVRELARSEPWRSLWASRKSEGSVFGLAGADLSEEQKGLITWSSVYDSVLEHPEAPPLSVVEDDDMLDGWLTIQRRRREKDAERSRADALIGSEKIRNSEEIFIVADSATTAQGIEELNDVGARVTKRKRMNLVQARGSVDETEMPDSKLKIQQQVTQQFAAQARG